MVGVTIGADLDPLEKTINDAKTKCYVDFGGGHYWTPIHMRALLPPGLEVQSCTCPTSQPQGCGARLPDR